MKGCLGFIIKICIAVLVFFGLVHLGAVDFIKDKINEYQNPSQEELIENTKDIVNLSQISNEYSIEKNLKILKNRMIISEHNASGQKMLIIEPKVNNLITKEDITGDNLEEKIKEIASQKSYKVIKFDKLKVVQKGTMKGINQEIPFAKIEAEVLNLPFKSVEGIIGCANSEEGKNLIIISMGEKGKYSQIIADAFFEKVK